jgi:leucyl/phenylalanyl-tRNA--protein transferase
MPVFHISEHEIVFPHPKFAEKDGLLGIGGDLSPERMLLAYQNGIFPWFSNKEPILWWCISPRLVIEPKQLKISHSMRSLLHKSNWRVSINTDFETVIKSCSKIKRKGQNGTWLHTKVIDSFMQLHELKYAHSVEVWDEQNELIGGLYGLIIGNLFCGESMFAKVPNASKFGFIHFVTWTEKMGITLIDCQQDTPHLRSFGAVLWSKELFFEYLEKNNKEEIIPLEIKIFDLSKVTHRVE